MITKMDLIRYEILAEDLRKPKPSKEMVLAAVKALHLMIVELRKASPVVVDGDRPGPEHMGWNSSVQAVMSTVGDYSGVPVADLIGPAKTSHVVRARQLAMHLLSEVTEYPYTRIGACFGNKNHATVIYSVQQISARRSEDKAYDDMVRSMIKAIRLSVGKSTI